jgi:hypothetical protein
MSLAQDFLTCIGVARADAYSQWSDDLRVLEFKEGRDRARPSKRRR